MLKKKSDPFAWLTQNSQMAALIRSHDWGSSTLGLPDQWPMSLKISLNLILESEYPMFIWWGPELTSFYNDAYCTLAGPNKHPRYFGLPAKEMWGEIWDNLTPFIDKVWQGLTVSRKNLPLPVVRNGFKEEAFFSFCYSPARDDEGQIYGVFCTCQETTQEMLNQKESEHAHRQLNDFFMQAPAPMVILLGKDHRFWIANEPYEKLIGRKVVGKSVLEVFSREEVNQYLPLLDGVYNTGIPHIGKEIPLNLNSDDGVQNLFINIGYHPFREADGSVKGILAIVEDVTEQVVLRKKIEQSGQELQKLSESIPQVVWSATPDGVLDYTNSRWFDYSGSNVPSDWLNFVHPDDTDGAMKAWTHSLETGKSYETEFRLRRIDGVYHSFLVRASAVYDHDNQIVRWYGTCTDIEDQKLNVLQLKQEKELREQFVSMLTHDLRNPLSAAKLSAQLLTRPNVPADKLAKLPVRITENLERANKMIENLLDANRIKAGERLPLHIDEVGLNSLVNDALIDLATVHGDRFELVSKKPVINGYWSHEGLLRILENLCNNAVKYGREHTPITVTLDMVQDEVSLSVHNFGNPIQPQELSKLFTPYQRNEKDKDAIRGWGLGLTLVKGLTESHRGRVDLESNYEKGTTFTVTIPQDSRESSFKQL